MLPKIRPLLKVKGLSFSFVLALLMQASKFVSLFEILDARFGPIFTKKLLTIAALSY